MRHWKARATNAKRLPPTDSCGQASRVYINTTSEGPRGSRSFEVLRGSGHFGHEGERPFGRVFVSKCAISDTQGGGGGRSALIRSLSQFSQFPAIFAIGFCVSPSCACWCPVCPVCGGGASGGLVRHRNCPAICSAWIRRSLTAPPPPLRMCLFMTLCPPPFVVVTPLDRLATRPQDAGLTHPNFTRQMDASVYTWGALEHRLFLKTHFDVQSRILRWWDVLPKRREGHRVTISKATYLRLFGTIALELRALAHYPPEHRWRLLEADWAYDAKSADAEAMDCDEFYEVALRLGPGRPSPGHRRGGRGSNGNVRDSYRSGCCRALQRRRAVFGGCRCGWGVDDCPCKGRPW